MKITTKFEYSSLLRRVTERMKQIRLECYILGGVIFFSLGLFIFGGVFVSKAYENGMKAREQYRVQAVPALKDATELWVNREFEEQNIPHAFYRSKESPKYKKKRMIQENGLVEVVIDSLKEEKRLLTSHILSTRIQYLLYKNQIHLDLLNSIWQRHLGEACSSTLMLKSNFQDNKKGKEYIAGDSVLLTDKYKLDTYYLDEMYFYELTAYLRLPSPWQCASWLTKESKLYLMGIIFCIFVLVSLLLIHISKKRHKNKEMKISENYVLSSQNNKRHQIGGIIFEEVTGMLFMEKQEPIKCSMQPYTLLSAFIHAENHFLSNERIIEICGWNPKDSGIDSRRRMAMSQLRKLIDSKNTHVQIVSGTDENKNNGFYLIVEKS